MVLDECLAYPGDAGRGGAIRWSGRSAGPRGAARGSSRFATASARDVGATNPGQAQFGIVQGGVFQDLRDESAEATVGDRLRGLRDRRAERRRADRPDVQRRRRDRAPPPRGAAALSDGHRHARRTSWSASRAASTCSTACCRRATRGTDSSSRAKAVSTSRTRGTPRTRAPGSGVRAATRAGTHSRAYLRHLYMAGEMTAGALNTLHNLSFYLDTMRRIRDAIAFRTFDRFRQEFLRSASRLSLDS